MMKKEAVQHFPLSEYAYATDEHSLTIRLKAAKEDLIRVTLFYGDRVDQNPEIRVYEVPMRHVSTDDLFDYYECEIHDQYTRVCYYFKLFDGTMTTYYYERGFCEEKPCRRIEFFQFPYIRREDIIQIPDWAKDIVMYHIFPDSFASGKREITEQGKSRQLVLEDQSVTNLVTHLGGTLQGVKENLDYLEELGVNCIYLNPIFTANSYHKYDTIDYFSIDPCFGTMEDFKELVQCCHQRGIRVLLDGVFNHCGANFFAFRDVLKKGSRSEYFDWFYELPEQVIYQDPPNYEAFAYVKEMPKLNTSNPELQEYLMKVGRFWIEEADIDGWRLDVANEINHDFWRRFRQEIRKTKPDAFLIGEIWEDANVWLRGDQFDSTMNYRFSYLCKDFFADRKLTVSEFDAQIQRMIMRYPSSVSLAQMNFLDSHDIPRFLSECKSDRARMELAFFYLFMGYGVPSVFYGDECYIEGTAEAEYRKAMPWENTVNCYGKFREWIRLRKEHSALRNGSYRTVFCDDERGIYSFERENEEEKVRVIINNSDENQKYEGETIPRLSGCVRIKIFA